MGWLGYFEYVVKMQEERSSNNNNKKQIYNVKVFSCLRDGSRVSGVYMKGVMNVEDTREVWKDRVILCQIFPAQRY